MNTLRATSIIHITQHAGKLYLSAGGYIMHSLKKEYAHFINTLAFIENKNYLLQFIWKITEMIYYKTTLNTGFSKMIKSSLHLMANLL